MFEFAWPWVFAMLPLPLLARLLLPRTKPLASALKVPFYSSLAQRGGGAPHNPFNLFLMTILWLLLLAATARPQWYGEPITQTSSARDLLLAVDISGSMETPDMLLNARPAMRIDAVKNVVGDFVERREGDRLGLVLFGTRAYLQAPLTYDRETVGTLLREAQIGFAGQGTAIGDAIGLSVKRLMERPADQRVLILLTDGANTAGEVAPLKAAELAQQAGVRVYTVGIGAEEMVQPGLLGSRFGARRINPSRDLDSETLQAIADRTGGKFFRAHNPEELAQIYAELDRLEPVEQEAASYRPLKSLYIWPLAAVLLMALLWAAIPLLMNFRLRESGNGKREAGNNVAQGGGA
ncbi:von Willebrand factor type A domain protein [Microbulbifer aggregans]|uniref:von Willebrand factor type A domain protein n=1 Tax=Microbulbifer aggregans TaxID=1769779 RepID=A0A1C9W9D9_9GAMM|nr:VWA domain-containing protein [Microbulbifer aggregans]AOS97774.1 von Willebrand factor type A domain protein [Microbulbifer aggregans]